MKITPLALALALTLSNAFASDIEYKTVCQIKAESDAQLKVKIISGKDACEDKSCYGVIYRANVISEEYDSEKFVSFSSSGSFKIGLQYLIFPKATTKGSDYFFYSQGYEVSYSAPKSIEYFVPEGASFLISGDADFYRELPFSCLGDGPDCNRANKLRNPSTVPTSVVLYPDFLNELQSCANQSKSIKKGTHGEI